MKIFVTGNTSGLGLATQAVLQGAGYHVDGGSRRTGMDIMDPDVVKLIATNGYDVIVNNAYHSTGQLELLKSIYAAWQGQNKTIVNVGSAYMYRTGRPFERLNYNTAKVALANYSYWIADNDAYCRSMMFNPGYIETPLGVEGRWEGTDNIRGLEPEQYAHTIQMMIESPGRLKEVTQIG